MTRVIGLTGGIASGKSTVAQIFRELGAPVVDADELARRVVEPGRPAYEDIVREFGPSVVTAEGALDRKKLADIVFADAAKRRRLQEITHPRIAQLSQTEIAAAAAPVVLYEAALIVENGVYKALAGLIVVSATPEQQLARAVARDGMTEAAARARIASQLPLAEKLAVATYVVDNSGTLAETRRQVEDIWRTVQA